MADSPGKKSGGHDDDCSYDTGVDSTPQPRRFHVSGSALPQRTFSSEDEQSDGDRTPTNSPGRRSQRRSSSLKDQQSSGDNTPTNSPGRRSQRRSSPFRDVLEKMLVIDGRLQREDFRAPRDQRRLPSSNKFQIISGQENEDSDAMVKSATSGAGLHLRLKNNLYELKAILKWHEIFDKYCGGKHWQRLPIFLFH